MKPVSVTVSFKRGPAGRTSVVSVGQLLAGLSPANTGVVGTIVSIAGSIGDAVKAIGDNTAAIGDRTGEIRDQVERLGDRTDAIGDDTRAIGRGVSDIAAWPLLTSELDGGGSGGGGGRGESGRLRPIVLKEIRRVLGGLPKQDGAAVAAALNASFELNEYEGHVRYKWIPRSYTGLINTGAGVTGAQASLATFARKALDETLPLIEGLKPLSVATDPEELEAVRSILTSSWIQFVDELGVEGGPRRLRADNLADQLAGPRAQGQAILRQGLSHIVLFGRHLGLLDNQDQLDHNRVVLTEEETTLTNYIVVRDYVRNAVRSWDEYVLEFGGGGGATTDLGSGLVRLQRALTVADESVDELYSALDSVFIGPDERLSRTFDFGNNERMTIEELLSWVQAFASTEAPGLVEHAGTYGVDLVEQTIRVSVAPAVADFLAYAQVANGQAQNGLQHPRVLNAIAALVVALESARVAAEAAIGTRARVFV